MSEIKAADRERHAHGIGRALGGTVNLPHEAYIELANYIVTVERDAWNRRAGVDTVIEELLDTLPENCDVCSHKQGCRESGKDCYLLKLYDLAWDAVEVGDDD